MTGDYGRSRKLNSPWNELLTFVRGEQHATDPRMEKIPQLAEATVGV